MAEINKIDTVLSALTKESGIFKKAALRDELIFYINNLLLNDFTRLVQLLYTVDVDEKKLKGYLSEHPEEDAAVLIADMLIGRQVQKEKDRLNFKDGDEISEDEKW